MPAIVESAESAELLAELTTLTGREDPYPRYDRLRAIAPLIRAEDGALVVTRYADCATVVRDGRLGHMPPDMLVDGPRHYLIKDVNTIRAVANDQGIELGLLGELANWVFE